MISKVLAACFVVLTFALGTSGASAYEVLPVYFTITSQTEPTLYFSVPEVPTPDSYTPGFSFELDNVLTEAVFKGSGALFGYDNYTFYNGSYGGGLSDDYFFPTPGIFAAQLYTGPESSPQFLTGFFPGTYFEGADPHSTIHISATATTPLPSTWLMLLSGFLGVAFFAGRRFQHAGPFAA